MKKGLQFFAVAFPLIIAVTWIFLGLNKTTAEHEYLITKYYRFEALREEPIVQEFVPTYKRLGAVELFIANVYPETEGSILLRIADNEEKTIFEKNYAASEIPTGEFFTYKIGKKVIPGNTYKIYLSYTGETIDGPQVMISETKKNLLETGNMYISGELSKYNMAITYHYYE